MVHFNSFRSKSHGRKLSINLLQVETKKSFDISFMAFFESPSEKQRLPQMEPQTTETGLQSFLCLFPIEMKHSSMSHRPITRAKSGALFMALQSRLLALHAFSKKEPAAAAFSFPLQITMHFAKCQKQQGTWDVVFKPN